MLLIHPASTCDICLEPYDLASCSPYAVPCGHIFCLSCLDKLEPENRKRCPLCRTRFDVPKKLRVDRFVPSDGQDPVLEAQENELLQRVAFVFGEYTPEEEVNAVKAEVHEWLSQHPPTSRTRNLPSTNQSSHRALRFAVAGLQRYKNLQQETADSKEAIEQMQHQFERSLAVTQQDLRTARVVETSMVKEMQIMQTRISQKDSSIEGFRLQLQKERDANETLKRELTKNRKPSNSQLAPFNGAFSSAYSSRSVWVEDPPTPETVQPMLPNTGAGPSVSYPGSSRYGDKGSTETYAGPSIDSYSRDNPPADTLSVDDEERPVWRTRPMTTTRSSSSVGIGSMPLLQNPPSESRWRAASEGVQDATFEIGLTPRPVDVSPASTWGTVTSRSSLQLSDAPSTQSSMNLNVAALPGALRVFPRDEAAYMSQQILTDGQASIHDSPIQVPPPYQPSSTPWREQAYPGRRSRTDADRRELMSTRERLPVRDHGPATSQERIAGPQRRQIVDPPQQPWQRVPSRSENTNRDQVSVRNQRDSSDDAPAYTWQERFVGRDRVTRNNLSGRTEAPSSTQDGGHRRDYISAIEDAEQSNRDGRRTPRDRNSSGPSMLSATSEPPPSEAGLGLSLGFSAQHMDVINGNEDLPTASQSSTQYANPTRAVSASTPHPRSSHDSRHSSESRTNVQERDTGGSAREVTSGHRAVPAIYSSHSSRRSSESHTNLREQEIIGSAREVTSGPRAVPAIYGSSGPYPYHQPYNTQNHHAHTGRSVSGSAASGSTSRNRTYSGSVTDSELAYTHCASDSRRSLPVSRQSSNFVSATSAGGSSGSHIPRSSQPSVISDRSHHEGPSSSSRPPSEGRRSHGPVYPTPQAYPAAPVPVVAGYGAPVGQGSLLFQYAPAYPYPPMDAVANMGEETAIRAPRPVPSRAGSLFGGLRNSWNSGRQWS